MNDDKLSQEEGLYVPTPKEVEMNRGKRRRRRTTSKSPKANKAKRQQRRRKGFSISKRATTRRTEASAPRPARRDPVDQKGPDLRTPRPVESSNRKPKVVPETTDVKPPSTRPQKGSRVRTVRPKQKGPTPPPVSKPEKVNLKGKPQATYIAEELGHQLNPWETAPGGEKGREEFHYTKCRVCGRKARATLEPVNGYPDRESTWRYTEGALENRCEG